MRKHTPGPWRWELNESSKNLRLVGGRPQFDLTIIEPIRWGMGSATLLVRDIALDGMNLLHKLHERRDWIAPFPGREHHARWCVGVNHPDLHLIEAAPELLEALREYVASDFVDDELNPRKRKARAAIAKAEGQQRPEPTDSRDPIRKEQARLEMEAWARAKLARHGIIMPGDDDGPLAF